ncbi:AEC family transporter [Bowmanella yangjiangensis]|uniref:AEC family transporter n=1 Tax=Bowmanella yangjiangensis TaxID=2811230 RepID=A0ABS3CVA2_9ALTE|nr:AEC family transporter [Bowmanella yangjiangensis]MBN7821053.1 AEC family transporter [Bowmanella yangjiangensis]
MENFVLVLIYILIGTQLRRLPQFPAETGMVLNQYVLYVALPALVMQKIPLMSFSADLWQPAVLPWAILLLVVGVVLLAGRLFSWDKNLVAALLVVLPLGNTSFLGFPMVEAFFGEQAMPYAIIYDQLGSFLALATYATIICAWYNPNVDTPSVAHMAKRVLLFPSFIALIAAMGLKGWPYPSLMQSLLDSLAATLVPVIMVAVGFQFRLRLDGKEALPLGFALVVKLLLMPLFALALLWPLHPQPLLLQVSVFQAAMPPMVSAGALAIGAALAPRLVAALVGLGLIMSFITLPMWYWLLQHLM